MRWIRGVHVCHHLLKEDLRLILNRLLRKERLRNYVGLSSHFFLRGLVATVWFRKRASAPSPQLQTVTLLARAFDPLTVSLCVKVLGVAQQISTCQVCWLFSKLPACSPFHLWTLRLCSSIFQYTLYTQYHLIVFGIHLNINSPCPCVRH